MEARVLLDTWEQQDVRVLAPGLLAFEMANALYRRVFRGQLALNLVQRFLEGVLDRRLELDHALSTHRRALELAHQFGRPACYDAHYLALAEREGCECWTADERLWNAVRDRLSWVRWVGELPPAQPV